MIDTVRAAGFAAAAVIVAGLATWSDTSQAGQGNAVPAATHYLDHAKASAEVSDIGLNEVQATAASGKDETQARTQSMRAAVERLVALADAGLPRPRTLPELIGNYSGALTDDEEQDCLANAVYFEARGEPIEGQLAVAEVVLNRTRSHRYPDTICKVVTEPWQFSFVRRGIIPRADRSSAAWRRAVAVARIAEAGASRLLPADALWYHADYVAPSWGRRLAKNRKIGLHIFYT